ncbi:signal peptidase II [Candidatus Viridilinea mediisalina]|uniref:Lipoprotein signal peptidase n=1 Tax=Candidatus Viridilinea mediisalina TaxID=2024553 RepID=A0A2A6RP23_9CHLR|nr:signal peptidase II [Candidatus Viridilinea mediisalina]PDW04619.1 signal peptidase II [Candidatus Viridilinea mediisalina]
MSLRPSQRWLLPLLLGLCIFLADQLSKLWIFTTLGPIPNQRSIVLMGDWLTLIYSRNTGVAFGLFPDMSQFFTFTSILITLGLLYAYAYHLPNQSLSIQLGLGMIAGGALGNIADRIRLGYVVDFISVGWWPVFNVADSGITLGVTILAFYLIFIGDEPPVARPVPRDDGLLRELLSRDVSD